MPLPSHAYLHHESRTQCKDSARVSELGGGVCIREGSQEWKVVGMSEGTERKGRVASLLHMRAALFSHGPCVGWQSRRQEYEKTGMRRKLRRAYHKARQNTFSIKVTRPKYTALCECDHYVRTASFKYAVECRLLLDKRVQIRTGTGKPTHKRGFDHDGVSEPANGFNHPQG